MAWTIEYSPKAVKAFRKKLDEEIVRRMIAKLEEAAALDDSTTTAKPMHGNLKGLWSYRIARGYRVVADPQMGRLVTLAIDAGHSRDVYADLQRALRRHQLRIADD